MNRKFIENVGMNNLTMTRTLSKNIVEWEFESGRTRNMLFMI